MYIILLFLIPYLNQVYKCFYLICPTDCLEQTINKKFKHENYFYTSLDNSFINDSTTIENLKSFIKKQHIKTIFLVLSMDNKIILDALGVNDFSNIGALNKFYKEIRKQKRRSKISLNKGNLQFGVLSYFLNKKIKELEFQLHNISNLPITISGKIYNRDQDKFMNIYSDLVYLEKHHLN